MTIDIDENSGFCFGVQNAVKIAENALATNGTVYSLGDIVHNDKEVERLASSGLITIKSSEIDNICNCDLLIRAHGEPPSTYAKAESKNIRIIDATCPIVKKLQERIKRIWEESKKDEGQIVIFGKPGHAEVIGLLGQTYGEGILMSSVEDIGKIDISKPIYLFSQTTMSIEKYMELSDAIRQKIYDSEGDTDNLHVYNTTCGQVSNREPMLREFARQHDVIIFVSGKESSNGKMLYSICKDINPKTFLISSHNEIERTWFDGIDSIGICGATSTPKWLLNKVYTIIDSITNKNLHT